MGDPAGEAVEDQAVALVVEVVVAGRWAVSMISEAQSARAASSGCGIVLWNFSHKAFWDEGF